MGGIFKEPWIFGIIIIVILLLFFAPKLPQMARSLGQSFRIIKSEVKESKNDGQPADSQNQGGQAQGQAQQNQTQQNAAETPVEGTIVNPPQGNQGNASGTGSNTNA